MALAGLKSNDQVFVHGVATTPTVLIDGFAAHVLAKNLTGIKTVHIHTEGKLAHLAPEFEGRVRDTSYFMAANVREAVNAGRADSVSVFLSEIPLLFRRGYQPLDVALINVSPPDKHGFCSLGPSVDVTHSALEVAKKVIAVINPHVPRVFGDGSIHISNIDVTLEHSAPLYVRGAKEGGPAEDAIGKLIAQQLVRNGATLQMGIGGIPDAVLRFCTEHKDLGIHSEMVSDGMLELVERGVITNQNKKLDPGLLTVGFAYGSKRLYDFLNDNPSVVMRDIATVNDVGIIKQQPMMTAINSAIEVDITGQVCADSIGTRFFSGVGGQIDFIRGAGACPDGRAIIALPSTTSKGQSRIVPFLKEGGGVVTTRSHVHWIVTEHGITNLFGKSMRERATLLISLAHPDHRESLRAAAKARGLC